MVAKTGIHKMNYRGLNIYWRGTYNVEGDGSFDSIHEARKAIDYQISHNLMLNIESREAEIAAGAIRAEKRDGKFIFHCPDGVKEYPVSVGRGIVFDIEDLYDLPIVWQNKGSN